MLCEEKEKGTRLTFFGSNCSIVGGEDWILEAVSCCKESCENTIVLVKLRESFVRLLVLYPHVRIWHSIEIIIGRCARGKDGGRD